MLEPLSTEPDQSQLANHPGSYLWFTLIFLLVLESFSRFVNFKGQWQNHPID